jgi:hypothetical protein
VLRGDLAVRAEPHAGMPAVFRLRPGELLRVIEESDRWVRMVHPRGEGWTERTGVGLVE